VPHDDEPEDLPGFGPPPPPDDRLWRHPSELGTGQPLTIVTTRPNRRRTVGIGVMSGLVGAAAMLAVVLVVGGFDRGKAVTVEQVRLSAPKDPAPSELALADRVMPAVAQVASTTPTGTTSGTAVVFRDDGHLLTTADVVDGATNVTVQLSDGTSLAARVVGMDRSSDLAVLKIDGGRFQTAVLGMESDLELGEPTIAIECIPGRPGAPTISVGLISALGKRVDDTNGTSLHDMIQTNVRVSTAESGAVLIDSSGAAIGLVTRRGLPLGKAIDERTSSTTKTTTLLPRYATPIEYAKQVADELILTGHVAHPWLGVQTSDLSDAAIDRLGRAGARVESVAPGSPAESAGLQAGDIVIGIDNETAIESSSDLVVALRRHHPGESVGVTYVRGVDQQVALATLAENTSVP
jgi:S1-C subfamily serine protease